MQEKKNNSGLKPTHPYLFECKHFFSKIYYILDSQSLHAHRSHTHMYASLDIDQSGSSTCK